MKIIKAGQCWIVLSFSVWIGGLSACWFDSQHPGSDEMFDSQTEGTDTTNGTPTGTSINEADSEYEKALARIPSHIKTKRIQVTRTLFEDEYSNSSTKAAIHSYWYLSLKNFSWELADRKYAVTFFYDENAFQQAYAIGTRMPVVIFSSGAGSRPIDYSEILCHIAEHGYIVAAMEHTYIDLLVKIDGVWRSGLTNSLKLSRAATEYVDEFSRLNQDNNSAEPIYPDFVPQFIYDVIEYEARDVKSFLDLIEQETTAGDSSPTNLLGELSKVIAPEKIAFAGHSLGGMTATLAATALTANQDNTPENPYYDERIKAVISFDGAMHNHRRLCREPYRLQKPYLLLAADKSWPAGDHEPPRTTGLLMTDAVMSIGGFEDQRLAFVVEILESAHESFWNLGSPKTIDTSASYVDLFLREVFFDQASLTWERFYNDECNSDAPTVSLKYSSSLPGWWFNKLGLCAPGADFPIPGNATGSENYQVVESRVLNLFDRLVDEVTHPSLEDGQSENLQQVREQIVQLMQNMGYSPQKEEGTGGTSFFNQFLPESSQMPGVYSGGVNILLDIPGTNPALPALYLTAHYDSVPTTPGANDPMSGVIAILEVLNRLRTDVDFSTHRFAQFERTLRIRFWDQEEVGLIGSAFYLEKRPELNPDNVYGLINLDTIGNFSSEDNSEPIPGALGFLFPDKAKQHEIRNKNRADFTMVIGSPGSKHLIDALKSPMMQRERLVDLLIPDSPTLYWLPIISGGPAIPLFFSNPFYNIFFELTDIIIDWNSTHDPDQWIVLPTTDIFRSDHAPFWLRGLTKDKRGIAALFVTDTANFRHADYHTPADTVENISLGQYMSLINRLEQATRKLLRN